MHRKIWQLENTGAARPLLNSKFFQSIQFKSSYILSSCFICTSLQIYVLLQVIQKKQNDVFWTSLKSVSGNVLLKSVGLLLNHYCS